MADHYAHLETEVDAFATNAADDEAEVLPEFHAGDDEVAADDTDETSAIAAE